MNPFSNKGELKQGLKIVSKQDFSHLLFLIKFIIWMLSMSILMLMKVGLKAERVLKH